jgi:hypothetical protein
MSRARSDEVSDGRLFGAEAEPRIGYCAKAQFSTYIPFLYLIDDTSVHVTSLFLLNRNGVSLYLLSGAVGTLAALWINRKLAERD